MPASDPAREISIVGYAVRLPQAPDNTAYWRLLDEGRCAVTEIAPERWPKARYHHPRASSAGRTYTWAAGQIDDVWGFDPGFFGISPREAIQIDPQQRLMLQVTWEALEHGALRPSDLAGSRTGVYVGASALDYSHRFLFDAPSADVQFMTGNTLSIISNRISYIYDLRGPSFTVDTACSSSLFALHEAAEALRAGRIDTAIVAGVNLLLSPFAFVGFSRASMLSPNGLCRAFDAAGDGYVRSEGAAVIVLRATSAARSAGNREYARLVATGVNSDGRTVGMSLPSSESQADLLEAVYQDFELDPADLAFIEAHGTGTRVGDPAEAFALGKKLGQRRTAPLPIGSVKTNIGHLEPASGLAGMIKAVMALEHDRLPPSLHFETPNPDIPFDDLNLTVAAESAALTRSNGTRLAGINSFGFGGANAHAVIADAPRLEPSSAAAAEGPLVLSARSEAALKALAARYGDHIEALPDTDRARVAGAAAYSRDALEHRLVVLDGDPEARVAALRDFAQQDTSPERLVTGSGAAGHAPVVFAYTGNGSQWAGMGCEAYRGNAVFRAAFDRLDRKFMSLSGWSLVSMLYSADLESEIERTEIAQPLLLAVQVGLTEALAAQGVTPAAVIGHSVGEVAAAWAAGMVTLDDAVRIIHARSTHQEMTRHLGGMAALLLPVDEARAVIAEAGLPGIEVAAINSPRSVTISGPGESLDAFGKWARKKRLAMRRLALDYPFHCHLVEPIREPLLQSLEGLQSSAPTCRFVSTVHPDAEAPQLDAGYWWDNVREPVRFAEALGKLVGDGFGVVLEVGPMPILGAYARDVLREGGQATPVLASLDKPKPAKRKESARTVASSATSAGPSSAPPPDPVPAIAASVFAHGGSIDLARFVGPAPEQPLPLPHYPWQNRTFRPDATAENIQAFTAHHWPLLGYRLSPELAEWFNVLDTEVHPFLADHKVEDAMVFPAAGFTEMALRAARIWFESDTVELLDMDILRPLVFEEDRSNETRVRISPDDRVIEIESRPRLEDAEWSLHVRATVARPPRAGGTPRLEVGAAIAHIGASDLYDLTQRFGLHYGPSFQRAVSVDIRDDRNAVVHLDTNGIEEDDFALNPTLVDSGFHGLFALLHHSGKTAENVGFLPVRIGRLRLVSSGVPASARIAVKKASPRSVEASFEFLDSEGLLVARLTGTRFRAVTLGRADNPDDLVYRTIALPLPLAGAPSAALAAAPELGTVADPETVAGESEPEEAFLLLEALARAIALKALAPFADDDHRLSPAVLLREGRVAENAGPLLYHLLRSLADTGLASTAETDDGSEPATWTLAQTDASPDIADLLRTIALEAPERIADLALLARLDGDLSTHLAQGLPASADGAFAAPMLAHFRTASPGSVPLGEALNKALGRLCERWPDREAMRVLLVGADDPALAGRLARRVDPASATLTVTDVDDGRLSRAGLQWTGAAHVAHRPLPEILADADAAARFDVVLGVDILTDLRERKIAELAARLAPGAILIAAESAPSPVLDMIFGIGADWWAETTTPEHPISRLRNLEEWRETLQTAGFGDIEGMPLATAASEAALILARTPDAPIQRAQAVVPADDQAAEPPRTLVIHDADGLSRDVAAALADALERQARTVTLEPLDADTPKRVAAAADAATDIIHLAGAFPVSGTSDDTARVATRMDDLVELLKALAGTETRLWLVAPDAMQDVAGGKRHDAAQAAVWTFGRVALNEFPDTTVRLVDISAVLEPGEFATRLADEILNPSPEREIVRDMDRRAGLRIVRGGLLAEDGTVAPGVELATRLDIAHQGSLDELAWQAVPRPAPVGDEVEIAVRASGLNFRDVMWALGLLPEEALEDGFAGPTLGMECAGEVTRVGPDVTRFAPGDTVLTFAPACFASHVLVGENALAPMPRTVSFEEAATIPVTFLTAYYALVELARLEADETVLIHGGAGGVGLAALQLAKWRGATVIATAGTPEKRNFLKLLGADHVLDSRSLDFAEDVMEITGDGVDVVLNSLFGEAMERSIGVLKPFGRFLELGKRDYYGNTRVGLRPFRQNLSYFGIDADQLLTRQPKLARRLFADLVALFNDGVLAPLPYRLFDAGSVVEAFRVMQQSGHIGKIVLGPPSAPEPRPAPLPVDFSGKTTQLVVGGFGGFGARLIRWLADHGATHVAVIGRSGATSEDALVLIAEMEARGVTVSGHACDASDETALATTLQAIRTEMPPLAGVFHTAMVLHDVLIANLDREGIDRVLAPKIAAAQHLDALTANDPVKTFVMFSSATTLVGNPGQANYVAANGYLEALARRRRAQGRPALAVAWGAISDAGYLARNTDVNDMLARKLGRHALTAAEALAGLERLLSLPTDAQSDIEFAALGYARIDWAQARRDLALLATPLVSRLGLAAGGEGMEEGAVDLAALLDGLDPAAAIQTVAKLLSGEIGRILRIAPEEIVGHKPLSDIGMDSLMALELRMAAERQLGVDIPLMSLANGATLNDLSARIVKRVRGEDTAISGTAQSLASQHFGDHADAPEDADLEGLAARVEETSRNVGRLLS